MQNELRFTHQNKFPKISHNFAKIPFKKLQKKHPKITTKNHYPSKQNLLCTKNKKTIVSGGGWSE